MPVCSAYFLLFAVNTASSRSTNLAGRSTRKLAPLSIGSFGGGTSAIGTAARAGATPEHATSPAPSASAPRRPISFIPFPPLLVAEISPGPQEQEVLYCRGCGE